MYVCMYVYTRILVDFLSKGKDTFSSGKIILNKYERLALYGNFMRCECSLEETAPNLTLCFDVETS